MKIEWIITDNISDVTSEEFDKEWNGIYGCGRITIGQNEIGYIPDRPLFEGEEYDDDILYVLKELLDSIISVNNNETKTIPLLTSNLTEIIVKRKADIIIFSYYNWYDNKTIFTQDIPYKEYVIVILKASLLFAEQINSANKSLLETRIVKDFLSSYNDVYHLAQALKMLP